MGNMAVTFINRLLTDSIDLQELETCGHLLRHAEKQFFWPECGEFLFNFARSFFFFKQGYPSGLS
jgi:hypothetical protein